MRRRGIDERWNPLWSWTLACGLVVGMALIGVGCASGFTSFTPSTFFVFGATPQTCTPNFRTLTVGSKAWQLLPNGNTQAIPDYQNNNANLTRWDDNKGFYWDEQGYKIHDPTSTEVRALLSGSYVVRTQLADNHWDHATFLEASVTPGPTELVAAIVHGVYVAYDARATVPPSWLTGATSGYSPVLDKSGNQLQVNTTMPDERVQGGNRVQAGTVRFNLWKKDSLGADALVAGKKVALSFPAVGHGGPVWPADLPQGYRGTYFVLLAAELDAADCTDIKNEREQGFSYCLSDADKALSGAYKNAGKCSSEGDCNKMVAKERVTLLKVLPNSKKLGRYQTYGPLTDILDQQDCPSPDEIQQKGWYLTNPRSYDTGAQISFTKGAGSGSSWTGSTISMRAEQNGNVVSQQTLPMEGTMDFVFDWDTGELHLHGLNVATLAGASFTAPGGVGVNDIHMIMLEDADATCQGFFDGLNPCGKYDIASDELVVSAAFDAGSSPREALLGTNAGLFTITLDTSSVPKTFQLSSSALGSLHFQMEVNGTPTDFYVGYDLDGVFTNWNPRASGNESTMAVTCDAGYNEVPVYLHGGGSVDIDDVLPSNNFSWYESYGLPGELAHGVGISRTLPAYSMEFGVHSITLRVDDQFGITDKHTFDVDVYDDEPATWAGPKHDMPGDRYLVGGISQYGTCHEFCTSDLGSASASDTCWNDSMVSIGVAHDGPEGLCFETGYATDVTWWNDDHNGNTNLPAPGSGSAYATLPWAERTWVQTVTVFDLGCEPQIPGWRMSDVVQQLTWATSTAADEIQSCEGSSDCAVNLVGLGDGIESLVELLVQGHSSDDELRWSIIETLDGALMLLDVAAMQVADSNLVPEPERDMLREEALANTHGAVEILQWVAAGEWPGTLEPGDL